MKVQSLRARLILIILLPLLVISLAAAAWQFHNATKRAEEIFDRGLLSAALAISRDIAVSDGDALSPKTRRLINDTSGGELFYHVYAPDGVFVTGYSTPPVRPGTADADLTQPFFYDARYQGREVRVLRFQDVTSISGVAGIFNITVWQNAEVRRDFVRDVVTRSFAVIALLVTSVALVVWFGVGLGLRPLLSLEEAIAKRSPSELEPIRRAVPIEARGLVTTLNALLDRVSRRISSKDEFISNAAHQLRNPVAGVLALAEAVQNAPTPQAAQERSAELVQAAREASQLTDQLLSYERASGTDISRLGQTIDLRVFTRSVAERFRPQIADTGITLTCTTPPVRPSDMGLTISGDEIMLQEALLNLLTNAQVHGGTALTRIDITLTHTETHADLCVKDDGIGIPPDKHAAALNRFTQANAGPGSGLGLPIAARVMANHGGRLDILDSAKGTTIRLRLPLRLSSDDAR